MNLGCASVTGLTVQDFVEARHDAQVYSALIASYPTINKPEPAADATLPPPPPPTQTANGNQHSQKSATRVPAAAAAARAPADNYNAGSDDDNDDDAVSVAATLSAAMAEGTNASEMLTLDWEDPQDARGSGGVGSSSGGAAPDVNGASSSSTLLEHYDEATGQWQLLDVATQEATQGPLPPSSPLPLSLLRLFETLDVNQDGSLSKEEVVAAATNGLLEMTPQEAADFFHELDANGDGQVSVGILGKLAMRFRELRNHKSVCYEEEHVYSIV